MPKPVSDNLIVKKLPKKEKTQGGLFIPDSAKEPVIQVEVIAVSIDKQMTPKIGDVVVVPDGCGIPIEIDDVSCLIIREADVKCIL